MGVSAEVKEEIKARRNTILDLIKESEKAITANELAELCGCTYSAIWNDLQVLLKEDSKLKSIRGLGYIYDNSEEQIKKSDLKNQEGYSDPTAGLAMRMMKPKEDKIGPGEVWEFQANSYMPGQDKRLFLTVSVHPDIDLSVGFEVVASDVRPAPNSTYICYFERSGKTYYVDTRRVMSKPAKYLTEWVGNLKEDVLDEIRVSAARQFGAQLDIPKEKPAAVVEEKVQEPIDYLLLKQRADIYEKVFYAVCGMKKGEQ